MIELFECAPLCAKISRASCRSNKSRGVFACGGCGGLGAAVNIDLEVIVMAKKQCAVDGCVKLSQHETNGMCKSCFTKSKKVAVMAADEKSWAKPFVATEVIDESDWQQQIIPEVDQFGLVTNGDGDHVQFGTDVIVVLALREAWARKEADWLTELSGLKTGETISRAVQMVNAVEGLGY